MSRNGAIGIFDSGVGGLTVFREIEKVLPNEDLIYLGDTAHVPYGNKSSATVVKFSINNVLFLLRKKVKLVVVACNTASSLALEHLRQIFSVPILGVIEAGVVKALKVSPSKRIAIIGTRSTINSRSYEIEIKKRQPQVKVYSVACPLFVPLVEEGILRGEIVERVIELYLGDLKKRDIDTLILACTHYPLLKREIAKYLKRINIIDSAEEMAFYTRMVLEERDLLNLKTTKAKREFYVTDEPTAFKRMAVLFLKRQIFKPKVINV